MLDTYYTIFSALYDLSYRQALRKELPQGSAHDYFDLHNGVKTSLADGFVRLDRADSPIRAHILPQVSEGSSSGAAPEFTARPPCIVVLLTNAQLLCLLS